MNSSGMSAITIPAKASLGFFEDASMENVTPVPMIKKIAACALLLRRLEGLGEK
jgi:hypothetical protein